jgi:hypothetical protein
MQENVKNQRSYSDLNQETPSSALSGAKPAVPHRPQVTIFVTPKPTIPDKPLFFTCL